MKEEEDGWEEEEEEEDEDEKEEEGLENDEEGKGLEKEGAAGREKVCCAGLLLDCLKGLNLLTRFLTPEKRPP